MKITLYSDQHNATKDRNSSGKKLVGKHMTMSLVENKTQQLWKSFMEQRTKISNTVGTELYSLQCYPGSYFKPTISGKEIQ